MTKESRLNVYRTFLNEMGLHNRIDDYDDLEFVRKDPRGPERRFTIFIVDDDPEDGPEFLSVACHNLTEAGDPALREFWRATMAELTEQMKVVKLSFEGDFICAACQIYVPNPESGCQVLMRCVETIEAADACLLNKLCDKIKGTKP